MAILKAFTVSRSWRPEVVVAGSGLTALPVWLSARYVRARAISYVHGLDLAVSHPVYRGLWFPVLRRMDRVIANSEATRGLARLAGIALNRISIVHPGVQLPDISFDGPEVERFRAAHGLTDRPLLLAVGRLSTRKGMREFVSYAMPRIAATVPKAMLLIVGDAPNDALRAGAQSRDSIRAAADAAGVADRVMFLGQITDYRQLGTVYAAADVHVFPVRDLPGDPEGFGMVAVEAAAHGVPTIAFRTGGVSDAVADGISGRLVTAGDYERLADEVADTLAHPGYYADGCRAFARRFVWSAFGESVAQAVLGGSVDTGAHGE
jgi:phosphatidylinositol alpha-1,6-mannosyltransferase